MPRILLLLLFFISHLFAKEALDIALLQEREHKEREHNVYKKEITELLEGIKKVRFVQEVERADLVVAVDGSSVAVGVPVIRLNEEGTLSQEEIKRLRRQLGLSTLRVVDSLQAAPHDAVLSKNPKDLQKGALLVLQGADDGERRAREAAVRVLDFVKSGSVDSTYERGRASHRWFTLNLKKARSLNLAPGLEVLAEFEVVDEFAQEEKNVLPFAKALELGLLQNMELRAESFGPKNAKSGIERARGSYMPSLELSLINNNIDRDRALASKGEHPQREILAKASLEWLLYSKKAQGALKATKHGYKKAMHSYARARADMELTLSEAYIKALRAKVRLAIEKENIKLVRETLAQSVRAHQLGERSKADIYRLKNELARAKSTITDARAAHHSAKSALKALLNLPQEQPLELKELTTASSVYQQSKALFAYFEGPEHRFMRDFTKRAVANSEKLGELLAAIAAKKSRIAAMSAQYYTPSLSLFYEGTRHLEAYGGASNIPSPVDDADHSFGIKAALALYEGSREPETERLRGELMQLQSRHAQMLNTIKKKLQQAFLEAKASYLAIGYKKEAKEAAFASLRLTTAAYREGSVDLIRLLDAKNAAMRSLLDAKGALFEYAGALKRLYRVLGSGAGEQKEGF